MKTETIFPGDKITAYGQTFTVWSILYQDRYADPGEQDVEFIDDAGNYHHWKEYYDKGSVIPTGYPGDYYRHPDDRDTIAVISDARTPGTYTIKILRRGGAEGYLGRYSSTETALQRLNEYRPGWVRM